MSSTDPSPAAPTRTTQEHHLTVPRSARYYTLGDPSRAPREVWLVCHGYGQLAARFIRHFAPLDDGTRVVVAPEALSRFYVGDVIGRHATQPVGATWMTREDRAREIEDYVRYLDLVWDEVRARCAGAPVLRVLGFSQGTATASRWTAMGRAPVERLVLWGGLVPPDLELARHRARLAAAPITMVLGSEDALVSAAAVEAQLRELREHGIPAERATFAGGHRIDPDALRAVAA